MEQFLQIASTALQGCPFWCLPLPYLQQMSVGSGTSYPFHWIWRVFHCCHHLLSLFHWILLSPSWILFHTGHSWPWQSPESCQYVSVWKLPIKQFPWLLEKLHLCLLWWSLHGFYQISIKSLIIVSVLCSMCLPLKLCPFDQSKSFGMEVFQTHGTLEQSLEFHNGN